MYEPYRGYGHLKFGEELRQFGSAVCSCTSGKDTVLFVVSGIESRHLVVTKVFVQEPSGAA